MKFQSPLIKTKFIKRYKRFFVDGETTNGEVLTAHCNNTGSMKGLLEEGNFAYFSKSDNPNRKLKYSLEMIGTPTSLVGVNTQLPNALTAEAISNGLIHSLTNYKNLKREVKYGIEGKSRIDILLTDDSKPQCYVEVKNVTLKMGEAASFPDAVTTRGAKHLDELIAEVESGNRAVMFYLIQRTDCEYFTPADNIDPTYSKKLRLAAQKGVELLAYSCKMSEQAIELNKQLEIKL